MKQPCSTCPWRKDAQPGYWHDDHFRDIFVHCQDDGLHTMLCHNAMSIPEAERAKLVCQGWVRVMGFDAIGVRIAVAQGRVSLEQVNDTTGPDLYGSFEEMLAANGVKLPKRNRHWRDRP